MRIKIKIDPMDFQSTISSATIHSKALYRHRQVLKNGSNYTNLFFSFNLVFNGQSSLKFTKQDFFRIKKMNNN